MAGLDDLYAQIPIDQIAQRLGAAPSEVDRAVRTLVPSLVGGLQHNAEDPEQAPHIHDAACNHAASGLLDGGVDVDQVDERDGSKAIAKIFGGNNPGQVATALSGAGAGGNDLIKQLLPILAPIVLAYIGKRLGAGSGGAAEPAAKPAEPAGGGLGDILGGILGGSKSDNPLGTILGNVLGGEKGGAIGDILGGLFRGR